MTGVVMLGDDLVQWLVVVKPKPRYIAQLSTYMVAVEAVDARAALYTAKNFHASVFNTLDRRYNDPVAKQLVIGALRTLQPTSGPK